MVRNINGGSMDWLVLTSQNLFRAKEKVEDEFAIEKVAQRYEGLYKEILEKV